MWSPEVVRELARLAAPGATLATWTVAGGVRAALADAGFRVEKREGFGPSARCSWACASGEAAARPRRPPPRGRRRSRPGRDALRRAPRLAGWDVGWSTHASSARGAPSASCAPSPTCATPSTRRHRAPAFLYALQHFRALQLEGYHLRLGPLRRAAARRRRRRGGALQGHRRRPGLPAGLPALRRRAGRRASSRAAGARRRAGGCLGRLGLAREPRDRAARARGRRVQRHIGRRVERLEREGADWRALDADGSVIAEAPTLIVANAFDAKRLLPEARLSLASVRGQVTFLPPAAGRALDVVVSGSGYVAPLPDGGHVVGATYQHDDAGEDVRTADHGGESRPAGDDAPRIRRRRRIRRPSPGSRAFAPPCPTGCPSSARPRLPGLWVATGLGSRGPALGADRRGAHRLEARGRALAAAARPRRRDIAATLPVLKRGQVTLHAFVQSNLTHSLPRDDPHALGEVVARVEHDLVVLGEPRRDLRVA